MRALQFTRAGSPLELVEREIPTPGRGAARVKVEACGVCHSDAMLFAGKFPGVEYPRIPGHEVAGVIDALGPGTSGWKVGQRVGIGWHGGWDGTCAHCRRGDFFACDAGLVTGFTGDGGYAEYLVAPESALARMPPELPAIDAAPLLCAGVTTYNSLRSAGLRGGDLVAIQGIGGLGHLGVQYAAKMGFRTVAIGRGKDKDSLAQKLGATLYLDSNEVDAARELARLGGARAVLCTAPSAKAMGTLIAGLGTNGSLLIVGVVEEPLQVPALPMILGRLSVRGCYSGTSIDSEDTLAFSVQSGVRSMNEVFPLERGREAFERMLSGGARFRVVLKIA
jgi:D-arabinose 1-dehydrogenase-like Zn-dependent alcohol dehydrogenase